MKIFRGNKVFYWQERSEKDAVTVGWGQGGRGSAQQCSHAPLSFVHGVLCTLYTAVPLLRLPPEVASLCFSLFIFYCFFDV